MIRQLKAWFRDGLILHRVNGKYFFWYHTAKRYKESLLPVNQNTVWQSLCIYPHFTGIFTAMYFNPPIEPVVHTNELELCEKYFRNHKNISIDSEI